MLEPSKCEQLCNSVTIIDSTNFSEENLSTLNDWLSRHSLTPLSVNEVQSNLNNIISLFSQHLNSKHLYQIRDRNFVALLTRSTVLSSEEQSMESGFYISLLFLLRLYEELGKGWMNYLFYYDSQSLLLVFDHISRTKSTSDITTEIGSILDNSMF